MPITLAPSAQPPVKGFTAWSFSRWNAYTKCPRQAKLSMIDKLPQPESPQMLRGGSIHEQAAAWIRGETAHPVPEELRLFEATFESLREFYPTDVVVEDEWAFDADWAVCAWDDWDRCRCRIKVDVAHRQDNVLEILDWKTGRYSPQWNVAEYELQLELYALGALLMFGHAIPGLTVVPRLVYLDQAVVHPEVPKTWSLADLDGLKAAWENRARPLLADRRFAPNPGRACRWCAFSASKPKPSGGHCEY